MNFPTIVKQLLKNWLTSTWRNIGGYKRYFFKPICFDEFLKCYDTNTVFLLFSAVVGEIDETIDSRLDLNNVRAEPIGPVVYWSPGCQTCAWFTKPHERISVFGCLCYVNED